VVGMQASICSGITETEDMVYVHRAYHG
jgi:hypothetical protein